MITEICFCWTEGPYRFVETDKQTGRQLACSKKKTAGSILACEQNKEKGGQLSFPKKGRKRTEMAIVDVDIIRGFHGLSGLNILINFNK